MCSYKKCKKITEMHIHATNINISGYRNMTVYMYEISTARRYIRLEVIMNNTKTLVEDIFAILFLIWRLEDMKAHIPGFEYRYADEIWTIIENM